MSISIVVNHQFVEITHLFYALLT